MPKLEIKNWNTETEEKITKDWQEKEQFKFDENTKKPIYSIDTPPPYINAPIHMGHASTYCYQDFFARYKRMKGYAVIFPLGLDRNGLPIEMGAEKKYKVSPLKIGREKFIEYCEKLLNEISTESTDTFRKLGISFTSWKQGDHIGGVYFTDSPSYRKLTQATFIDLYKKGVIYEANRINNWDPKLQTTIADSEIDYKETESTFNDVKWKVKETGEEIVIGTTRPELICTCGMVIYNPEDDRYKHLEGKTAITPLFGKEVPIKAHPMADKEKGTGLVMICSAGDLTDIQFFREMNLEPTIAINKDGTMNENAGEFKGMKVKEARKAIIEKLQEKGLLAKQKKVMHRIPISERSKAEVEFIEMPEFYLKQLEVKSEVKKAAKDLRFYPPEARKILDDWIETVSIDWPISRRRYYATPIPLWYSDDLVAVAPEGEYYVPWKEQPPEESDVLKDGKIIGKVKDYKDKKWEGETRILDTWFDSSISELYISKYKEKPEFFKKAYPVSLRPQGKEIVRTWLYYTLLRGYLETGKACFEDVWIHQHILDPKGRKMSKSLGNVIDPQKMIEKYGGEALRLWAASEGNLAKQDMICSEQKMQGTLKTINKLLNVSKFVMLFEKPEKAELTELDKLFTDKIEELTKYADENFADYEFHKPMTELKHFLWETFASHYIELVKNRAYNRDNKFEEKEVKSAKLALHLILERLVKLFYPVIPQATSVIADAKGIDLHNAEFPKHTESSSDLAKIEKIMEFNKEVWKEKTEKGIALNAEIQGIEIPDDLKEFEKDLRECHKLT